MRDREICPDCGTPIVNRCSTCRPPEKSWYVFLADLDRYRASVGGMHMTRAEALELMPGATDA